MGEVYKARDTRLDRIVAVKILPELLAADPQFRERFEREARTISQLAHPHICTLYDVGEDHGVAFIVLEHLEGETLADRLARGRLPLDQALTIAVHVADALSAAHRAGVVHRDLKPANVMLTKAGGGSTSSPQAKLLDFGLAKTAAPVVAAGASMMATTPVNITAQGTILGTFQYMSPEQIEGQDADARSDVFAFGCVLYELLTGVKAFQGKTQASLIGAILKDQPPPITTLQPIAPAALDHVVQTCLAKHPDERWQSASDLLRELKWIAANPSTSAPVVGVRGAGRRERLLAFVAAISLVVSGAMAWTAWRALQRPDQSAARPMRFTIALPPDQPLSQLDTDANNPQPLVAVSPDGSHLAYTVERGGTQQLFVRDVSTGAATALAGTDGARSPFFSPDGRWIGFQADGKLKKMALGGGAAVTLCDARSLRGASWTADDTIAFVPDLYAGVWRVRASGGKPEPLTTVDATGGERSHRWPEVLPGGKAVVFAVGSGAVWDDARIVVQSLDTGARKTLIDGGSSPRYLPTGHLVYARAGALAAVPFDPVRLEVTGPPVKLLDGLITENDGAAQYSFSRTGLLISVPASSTDPKTEVVWVDRGGLASPAGIAPGKLYRLALAPDGVRVAVQQMNMGDLRVYDLRREIQSSFRSGTRSSGFSWMPDGKRIVFSSEKTGAWNIFWKRSDGSGGEEELIPPGPSRSSGEVSPDGQSMAYTEADGSVWLFSFQNRQTRRLAVRADSGLAPPAFSADGRYLAFTTDDSGQTQVFVTALPAAEERWRVSTQGGTEPKWSPDGRELFYRNRNQMLSVAVTARKGSFEAGPPRVLFGGRFVLSNNNGYSVSADGKRFLMLRQVGEDKPPLSLDVVTDWFADVARLSPTRK